MPLLQDSAFGVILDASGAPVFDTGPDGSRTATDIAREWLTQLLPSGQAWPTDDNSNLAALLSARAISRETLEADIYALTQEISPGTSVLLLDDYQTVLGPDPAGRDTGDLTITQRQNLLQQRWVSAGGQSIAFYVAMGEQYGITLTIEEPDPPICGVARAGASTCGQIALRYQWICDLSADNADLRTAIMLNAPADTIVYFRVAGVWI